MMNLIIYYSRAGENYFKGDIKFIEKGNTEYVAEFIQGAVGGELFKIDTVKDYPIGYYDCTEEAKKELENNVRPKLKNYISDISCYDNIFVCGPCWWGTYPMAVFSQLERLDFAGKNVIPVMTHEGSGFGDGERDLEEICKGAIFKKGLELQGTEAQKSRGLVADWAKKVIA